MTSAVKETGEDEWKLRLLFDRHLITPARTRGVAFHGVDETEGCKNEALEVLDRERIVREEKRAGSYWFELTHDRLIRPIQEANERARQHRPAAVNRRRLLLVFAGLVALGLVAAALAIAGAVGIAGLRGLGVVIVRDRAGLALHRLRKATRKCVVG